MCLAVPMKIVEIDGETGVAEVGGVRRQVSLALLAKIKVNDWVMIHAGFAITRLSRRDAQKTLSVLGETSQLG